jgi:hypothetical protein
MATLTVTDDEDGTGATATVSGSAGAVNVVFVGKATGELGALAYAEAGSRVGDGTVPLALEKGLWFAYLVSGWAFSGHVYFAVTDGADAVATRCRRSVADTIRLLPIPPAAHVYEHGIPEFSDVFFPNVILSIDGVEEHFQNVLATLDYVGRPVKVQINDRCDVRELITKLPTYEKWREMIGRCFVNQRLAGVLESHLCQIEPYVIVDPKLPQYEFMVSGLVVRATCRERRGVGL